MYKYINIHNMQRSGVLVSSPEIVKIVCKTITIGMYDYKKIVKVPINNDL